MSASIFAIYLLAAVFILSYFWFNKLSRRKWKTNAVNLYFKTEFYNRKRYSHVH